MRTRGSPPYYRVRVICDGRIFGCRGNAFSSFFDMAVTAEMKLGKFLLLHGLDEGHPGN